MASSTRPACGRCVHFRNDPAFLEEAIAGLASLGSAYASVRAEDGLCLRHERYLPTHGCCADFSPRSADSGGTRR